MKWEHVAVWDDDRLIPTNLMLDEYVLSEEGRKIVDTGHNVLPNSENGQSAFPNTVLQKAQEHMPLVFHVETEESILNKSSKKGQKRKAAGTIGTESQPPFSVPKAKVPKTKVPKQNDNRQANIKVYNDIYVDFDTPLQISLSLTFRIHWSSKIYTKTQPLVEISFTFEPKPKHIYKLDILRHDQLVPILKEENKLPKKPSNPNQDSLGGIYYLQIDQVNQDNPQLYQLYSKHTDKDQPTVNNTLKVNALDKSMVWTKQDNYTNVSDNFLTSYQISSIIQHDANLISNHSDLQ